MRLAGRLRDATGARPSPFDVEVEGSGGRLIKNRELIVSAVGKRTEGRKGGGGEGFHVPPSDRI